MRFVVGVLILLSAISCSRDTVLSDPQGNVYETITIGHQEWMAGNLKYDVGEDCYCYNDDRSLCEKMGRLYTWRSANMAAEAIRGWHLPLREEWEELIEYCGVDSVGYERIVSDSVGFQPQWSGVRTSEGIFKGMEFNGVNYWSASTADTNAALAYSVAILSHLRIISPHNYPKGNACSVRLIRDR